MPKRFPYLFLSSYVLVSLAAQLGCWALLRLSQFGQNPFPELPLAVVLFFGSLFSAPLLAFSERLPGRFNLIALAVAVAANVALGLALSAQVPGAELYLAAPAAALSLAEIYRRFFKRHAHLLAAVTVYIACTLLANYTFDSFLPLPGYGLINVGTLFFGVTFTQRDRVHQYGRGYAYLMIVLAALANVVTALGLGTPLRYVAVGFAAILISEAADTEVYQRFLSRRWVTRVAASNAVSVPLDTAIFTLFAFYGEPFATPAWLTEVMLTDVAVKFAVGLLAAVRIAGLRRLEA